MSRLTRDGTAETVFRDQILRHECGHGNINFPCSAEHEQDWQPYPVDPHSCYMCDHTYTHTYIPRITEQPQRHGSSARYILRDPTTQGYRPGGACKGHHVARYQGNRLGAQDRSLLFLTILFGRTVITLQTPPVIHGPGPARCR